MGNCWQPMNPFVCLCVYGARVIKQIYFNLALFFFSLAWASVTAFGSLHPAVNAVPQAKKY